MGVKRHSVKKSKYFYKEKGVIKPAYMHKTYNKSLKKHIVKYRKTRNPKSRIVYKLKTKRQLKQKGGSSHPFHPNVKNNVAKYSSFDPPESYLGCAKKSNVDIKEKYYTHTDNGTDYYAKVV